MRFTQEQLDERLRNNPALARRNQVGGEAPSAQSQSGIGQALYAASEVKARHPRKRLVRITCFRARHLQDPDNGVYKWHIDAIRHAGLVDDDTAEAIRLEIQPEVKVATQAEERVEIEVIPL